METPENQPPPSAPPGAFISPRWSRARRWAVGLAIFATLIGLFYTEEDVRGARAWKNCKRELESKGVKLDWAAYLPTPVPDSENVFAVPEMQEWFTGRGATEFSKKLGSPGSSEDQPHAGPMALAEVTIGLPGTNPPDGVTVLHWDDPGARTEAGRLMTNALGPAAVAPPGFAVMARQPEEIHAARIFLECQTTPAPGDLEHFLPQEILRATPVDNGCLTIKPAGHGSYQATLPAPYPAAHYLAWSDQFEPEFALIRRALQRPASLMAGDHATPPGIPIPNFVTSRAFAQLLAARTQCHLLTGQPGQALEDLALMHQFCRILENRPTTLVGAMTEVAITGLYADTIADGLRLRAWREPQLAALEEQLQEVNLPAALLRALDTGSAHFTWVLGPMLQTRSGEQLANIYFGNDGNGGKTDGHWFARLAFAASPRGWRYQNMVAAAHIHQRQAEAFDTAAGTISPAQAEAAAAAAKALSRSPYSLLAAIGTPDLRRAMQTCARQQTLVGQAMVACALERYHFAHNEYPQTLGALAPQFIAKIPRDVIGGAPLRYRRVNRDKFLLYSIGWNEKDDGGISARWPDDGDWVWPDAF